MVLPLIWPSRSFRGHVSDKNCPFGASNFKVGLHWFTCSDKLGQPAGRLIRIPESIWRIFGYDLSRDYQRATGNLEHQCISVPLSVVPHSRHLRSCSRYFWSTGVSLAALKRTSTANTVIIHPFMTKNVAEVPAAIGRCWLWSFFQLTRGWAARVRGDCCLRV